MPIRPRNVLAHVIKRRLQPLKARLQRINATIAVFKLRRIAVGYALPLVGITAEIIYVDNGFSQVIGGMEEA